MRPTKLTPVRWGMLLGWECKKCGRKYSGLDIPTDEKCHHGPGNREIPNVNYVIPKKNGADRCHRPGSPTPGPRSLEG